MRRSRSATNDHRLGANEAPPAIISIFLGDQLTDVFDQIAKGGATNEREGHAHDRGRHLPVLPTDPGDRNRTSLFVSTGNRFESPCNLRSSQTIAAPMVTINTILADSLDFLAGEIEMLVADGTEFNVAVQKTLEDVASNHGSIVFNGDGYSEEWQISGGPGAYQISERPSTVPRNSSPKTRSISSADTECSQLARCTAEHHVALEHYASSIAVEVRTLEMANTVILPAAMRYQTELAANVAGLQSIGIEPDRSTLDEVCVAIDTLRTGIASLRSRGSHRTPLCRRRRRHATRVQSYCPRWHPYEPLVTPSKFLSPTTSGHCPAIRRCSSSF